MAAAELPASLLAHVSNVECLNHSSDKTIHNMLAGKTLLESDCDEQLLCHFRFPHNEAVKAQAIKFTAPVGAKAVPNNIRVYINESTLLFASVDSVRAVESTKLVWRVSPLDPTVQEAVAWLPKARQLNAYHVGILIADNASGGDDDVTVLSGLDVLGEKAKGLGTTAAPQKG